MWILDERALGLVQRHVYCFLFMDHYLGTWRPVCRKAPTIHVPTRKGDLRSAHQTWQHFHCWRQQHWEQHKTTKRSSPNTPLISFRCSGDQLIHRSALLHSADTDFRFISAARSPASALPGLAPQTWSLVPDRRLCG